MEDIIEKDSEHRESSHIVEAKAKQFGIAQESPRGEIKEEQKFTFEE